MIKRFIHNIGNEDVQNYITTVYLHVSHPTPPAMHCAHGYNGTVHVDNVLPTSGSMPDSLMSLKLRLARKTVPQ